MDDAIKEIKDIIKKGKVIFGSEQAIKSAKKGELKTAFLASNCKQEIKDDLSKYANISEFGLIQLEIDNRDLGTIAKKPFSVSVIGVLR